MLVKKIVAAGLVAVLMCVLVGGLFLLRRSGADGACGMRDERREIGNAIKLGGCR